MADIFSSLKNIFEKKELPPIDGKGQDGFMITRYLSMYPPTILDAIDCSRYLGKISNTLYNRLLYFVIEKEKPPFIRYIKKKKGVKIDKKLQAKICEYYCCNEHHANEIVEVLKAQGIKPKHLFGMK
jgi:hypothetical protein